jgi:hypothetical protein
MAKKKQPEFVVLQGDGIFCRHCGEQEKLFPARISPKRSKALMLTIEAFQEEHARCPVTENSPVKLQGRSPLDWLRGGDVGLSSETICRQLGELGEPKQPAWPRDPSDFGRCHRLLKLFPSWRARMPEIAARYPATPWVAYVREWDRMAALYDEEAPSGQAPKLWELMKQLRSETGHGA